MTTPSEADLLRPEQLLSWACWEFPDRFAIVTSFQKEGMILVDMAARISKKISVVTIDTGRLPEETYAMMETVRDHYGMTVEALVPDSDELSSLMTLHGPNLFRRDVPLRKLCCEVRKVRPLAAKMQEFGAYAVGLRRGQSDSRAVVAKAQLDSGRWKLSPLADWTAAAVEEYIAVNGVPVHPLYAAGYQTIGCGCCTRASAADAVARAGRWWWEEAGDKECGLHVTPKGELKRELDVLLDEVVRRAHE